MDKSTVIKKLIELKGTSESMTNYYWDAIDFAINVLVRTDLRKVPQVKASHSQSEAVADSIEAACFLGKGLFVAPRESWLREWVRQLRWSIIDG